MLWTKQSENGGTDSFILALFIIFSAYRFAIKVITCDDRTSMIIFKNAIIYVVIYYLQLLKKNVFMISQYYISAIFSFVTLSWWYIHYLQFLLTSSQI